MDLHLELDQAALAGAYSALAGCDLPRAAALTEAAWGRGATSLPWRLCRAEVWARCGRYREALTLCEEIVAELRSRGPGLAVADAVPVPTLMHTMARIELALGHFQPGLRLLDSLRPAGLFGDPPIATASPLWNGESLVGRTLCLATEGGLGDIVCFARFAAAFGALGARVVLATDPGVCSLLRSMAGADFLLDRAVTGRACFDYWVPALSAPRLLGLELESLPRAPYLSAQPATARRWAELVGAERRLRVGLCWQGRREFVEDHLRSIPAARVAPLLDGPDIAWYKLQLWEGENTLSHPALIDLTSHICGVDDLAGLIGQMDLVISVDSGPAHLAAALGCQTWLLNRMYGWITFATPQPPLGSPAARAAGADGAASGYSPTGSHWYERMRIYTQVRFGDWNEPLAAVAADLRRGQEQGSLRSGRRA
jgi:hypothetical protein